MIAHGLAARHTVGAAAMTGWEWPRRAKGMRAQTEYKDAKEREGDARKRSVRERAAEERRPRFSTEDWINLIGGGGGRG